MNFYSHQDTLQNHVHFKRKIHKISPKVMMVMRKLDIKTPVLVLGWDSGDLDLVTSAVLFMSIPSRSKL